MVKRKHPRRQTSRTPSGEKPQLLIWGRHPARAALCNPDRRVTACHVTKNAANALFADNMRPLGLPIYQTSTRELATRLPAGAIHQGVVLDVDPLPRPTLNAVLEDLGKDGPLVILDQVTDPHNIGAILRSCAVFGALALVTTNRHAPPETGTLAKAAAGALDVVPWIRVGNLAQALDGIRNAGWWVVGLSGDAEAAIGDARLHDEGLRPAVVLGAEGKGIRRLVKEKCDILLRIPMLSENTIKYDKVIDSLNVSNAAAVALYEISRNRAVTQT